MSSRTPQPYQAYKHIGAFLEARGMAPVSGEYPSATCGEFLSDLALRGHRRVIGCDAARQRYVIVLLLGGTSKYATQKPRLVGLLNAMASEAPARAGKVEEIIVLVPRPIFDGKKNITGVTPLFQRAAKNPGAADPSIKAAAQYYSTFPYELMLLDLMAAQAVVKHVIATPGEVREVRDWLNVGPGCAGRDLPRIFDTDPVVVWLGARPGQLVRVDKPSRQTVVSRSYYLVRETRKR